MPECTVSMRTETAWPSWQHWWHCQALLAALGVEQGWEECLQCRLHNRQLACWSHAGTCVLPWPGRELTKDEPGHAPDVVIEAVGFHYTKSWLHAIEVSCWGHVGSGLVALSRNRSLWWQALPPWLDLATA